MSMHLGPRGGTQSRSKTVEKAPPPLDERGPGVWVMSYVRAQALLQEHVLAVSDAPAFRSSVHTRLRPVGRSQDKNPAQDNNPE